MSTLAERDSQCHPSTNTVVAITGASSGIGEATARLLAERGASVAIGARRTERLDAIADDIPKGRRSRRHLRNRCHSAGGSRPARRPRCRRVRQARRSGQQRGHQQDRAHVRPRCRRLVGDDRRQSAWGAARHRGGVAGVRAAEPRALRDHRFDRRSADRAGHGRLRGHQECRSYPPRRAATGVHRWCRTDDHRLAWVRTHRTRQFDRRCGSCANTFRTAWTHSGSRRKLSRRR